MGCDENGKQFCTCYIISDGIPNGQGTDKKNKQQFWRLLGSLRMLGNLLQVNSRFFFISSTWIREGCFLIFVCLLLLLFFFFVQQTNVRIIASLFNYMYFKWTYNFKTDDFFPSIIVRNSG